MISIDKWFKIKNKIKNDAPDNKKIFPKYFYLNWISNKEYEISWTNDLPEKYNFLKEVHLRGYNEKLIFIGNIIYNKVIFSMIKSEKNYYSNNTSFLKSHLQKCVRRGEAYKSILTTYLLIEKDISALLRRLVIIILEDVHIIQEIDIIVWFMVMCNHISVPNSYKMWLLYLIKYITELDNKMYYEKLSNDLKQPIIQNLDCLDKLSKNQKSVIYSLMIRRAYGGMKGDMAMIDYLIYDWAHKFDETGKELGYIKSKNVIIYKTLDRKYYELSAADFHCWPKLLDILNNKYPEFDKLLIKKTIWHKSSCINFRIKHNYENNNINKCWLMIEEKLLELQKEYIKKNIWKT